MYSSTFLKLAGGIRAFALVIWVEEKTSDCTGFSDDTLLPFCLRLTERRFGKSPLMPQAGN
jgi:hypothetical protein